MDQQMASQTIIALYEMLPYPSRQITKKHNSIAYHKVRESVASGALRIAHEAGETNLADMLTKFLPPPKHMWCCQCIMRR
jgi:hypothetical protein